MVGLWLSLGLVAGKSLATSLWSFVTAPFRGEAGAATVYKHVALTFARSFFTNATIEQIQYVLPSESAQDAYESLMPSKNIHTPKTVTLPNGTSDVWIGNPDAEKVIIYFPGGGYCIPALSVHFELVDALTTNLGNHGQEIGVLFLTHDLAPRWRWPRQLEQAVRLVEYAIETLGKMPSNIVIAGDSSGGHLALAVLSHLAHPHLQSSIPSLLLKESFRGLVLLSPWVDFEFNAESVRRNAMKDTLSAKALHRWAQAVFGNSVNENFSNPIKAPAGYWKNIAVDRIFIGAGADEILLDSIVQIAHQIKAEHSDVLISVAPREFHAEPITDFGLKLPPGSQFEAMAAWLNQSFHDYT